MIAVYKHELKTYFSTILAYVFAAILLLFVAIYTTALCLSQGYASFEYVFGNMSFVFFIIVPIVTMRSVAEERKQRTDQLLYSLPISTTDVILGKYFALLTVLALPLLVTCIYPLILLQFGTVNLLSAYSSIIAFFFLGAAFLAIGLFISSTTESQVLSAGVCLVVLLINYFLTTIAELIPESSFVSLLFFLILGLLIGFILYLITKNIFVMLIASVMLLGGTAVTYFIDGTLFEGLATAFLKKLSLFERFYSFMYQTFNMLDLIFLVSVSVLFIFLAVQSMEKRRWSE